MYNSSLEWHDNEYHSMASLHLHKQQRTEGGGVQHQKIYNDFSFTQPLEDDTKSVIEERKLGSSLRKSQDDVKNKR